MDTFIIITIITDQPKFSLTKEVLRALDLILKSVMSGVHDMTAKKQKIEHTSLKILCQYILLDMNGL